MKILLVEDESGLSDALAHTIKKQNYSIDCASNGHDGLEMALTNHYHVMILDRMLPGLDGLDILKALRRAGNTTPVLFLTARDSIADRIEGLDCGADDYLVKPFSKEELLARIRSLSRRYADLIENEAYAMLEGTFIPLKGEIHYDGRMVRLTAKEVQILEILIRNIRQVITREMVFDRIWGLNADIELNNVDVYVSYLRKKLKESGWPLEIETIRGFGYRLIEVR